MQQVIFKDISEMHEYFNFPEPENPLFSIIHTERKVNELASCDDDFEQVSLTNNFFSISFKNIISGEILYGRTKYDCSNGTMLFIGPNQTSIFKDIVVSSESYHIAFHEDYIAGHEIRNKIRKYGFFNYNVNEALHLSPKEEQMMKSILTNIEEEYYNNQDEYTKELILSQLDTLLKYSDRFYKRQFLNRKQLNTDLSEKFNSILVAYFESNMLELNGIPSIEWVANKLSVTQRYLSDALKVETGRSALDHINSFLIDEAKNMLLQPNVSISETAYKLGFEYPQYFSRLFKKKVGISPTEYIDQLSRN